MMGVRREPELNPFPDIEPIWDNVRPVGRNNPVLALLAGQHPFSRRLDGWARTAALTVAAAVIVGSVVFAARIDLPRRFGEQIADVSHFAMREAGFAIGDILVSGRTHTDMDALRLAIGLNRGDAILAADPDVMRRRIEALPWVRGAEVARQLPDVIRVRLVERIPFALWQRNGRIAVVDAEGVILPATGQDSESALPIIIGAEAPANAPALFAILAEEPGLSAQVRAATWVDGRRWTLRLDSGIDVLLPADNPRAAWTRLAGLERSHNLLARDITAIDLRLEDRLFVQLGAGAFETIGIEQDA